MQEVEERRRIEEEERKKKLKEQVRINDILICCWFLFVG